MPITSANQVTRKDMRNVEKWKPSVSTDRRESAVWGFESLHDYKLNILKFIIMGIFSNPKCPRCGCKTVETGYSFPYPQFRCNNCVSNSEKAKAESRRIQDLEYRLAMLEKNIKNN